MKRLFAVALFAAGCTASGPPRGPMPVPAGGSRAPYDGPPVSTDTVKITLDMRGAREILALLSQPAFSSADAKLLETVPAVEYAIRDSNRPPETFERDLAAAFDEESRIAVFDFRKIKEDSSRWQDLLAMISTREVELAKLASDRARALLPGDRVVSVELPFYLTFGLPGRADHIMVAGAGRRRVGRGRRSRARARRRRVLAAGGADQAPVAADGERGVPARLGRVPAPAARRGSATTPPSGSWSRCSGSSPRPGRSRSTAWTRTSSRSRCGCGTR